MSDGDRPLANNDKCLWCDKRGIALCDAVLGFTFEDGLITLGPHFTCDAPMCGEHASNVGHICGKEPDSIDHCPYHIEHPDDHDHADGEHESAVRRRAIYATARRSQLGTVAVEPYDHPPQ